MATNLLKSGQHSKRNERRRQEEDFDYSTIKCDKLSHHVVVAALLLKMLSQSKGSTIYKAVRCGHSLALNR